MQQGSKHFEILEQRVKEGMVLNVLKDRKKRI
jgi:hypothetical protein